MYGKAAPSEKDEAALILITNKTVDKKSSHNPYMQDYAKIFCTFFNWLSVFYMILLSIVIAKLDSFQVVFNKLCLFGRNYLSDSCLDITH